MSRLFGTDGVRGIANEDLSPELAYRLGMAAAKVLSDDRSHKKRILLGMDTRLSGDMLEAALVAGLNSVGADAILAGVVPTPAVAWLTRKHGFDAGAVISASHNPYEFNGIKFFSRQGYKLPDEVEDQIEDEVRKNVVDRPHPTGAQMGRSIFFHSAADEYREHLAKLFKLDLSGVRIGIDCANGASFEIAPELFQELGAEIHVIGDQPDGVNINEGCGSTHVSVLQDLVREKKLDLGLAFDGDADRLIAVDDQGELVDGDCMLAVMALDMKKRGELRDDTLVVTVMSNLGLDHMAEREGIQLVKTKVGDRYVLEEMLKSNYSLGGEQSGHMIMLEHSTTGDGMMSALFLLRTIKEAGAKLSELRRVITILPQVLVNAKVANDAKQRAMEDEAVLKAAKKIEDQLQGRGRLLLRPSGTEPFVRVMIEGDDQAEIQSLAENLAKVISRRFDY